MPTEKTILNPKTGRTIIVGGPTYAVLVREGEIKCKDRAFRKPKEPKAPKEPRKKKEAKAPSSSGRKAVKKEKPKKDTEPKKEEPKKEEPKKEKPKKDTEPKKDPFYNDPFKADGMWAMRVRDVVETLELAPSKIGKKEMETEETDIVILEYQTFDGSFGYTFDVRWRLLDGQQYFKNGGALFGFKNINTSSIFAANMLDWEYEDPVDSD